ncbi:hypothetical protein HOO65_010065 [Ceratocystis lukuohia]|uniref:Uncharacterized protein n=2 Tax=Ceratocystis TaxID=5157 RepID=A0A0F8BMP0_CERFI|nr:hypothetical protein CFO_g3902 [Ceratocystis platani]
MNPDDASKPKKGLGRALARIKTVLKRGAADKRRSIVGQPDALASPSQPQQPPQALSSPQPQSEPQPANDLTQEPTAATATPEDYDLHTPSGAATPKPSSPPAPTSAGPPVSRVARSQIYEERAKSIADKFGLNIKSVGDGYMANGEALRVEKPIRMRVHRTCHMCSATFGATKECLQCRHIRCDNCIRHPPEQSEVEREANRERIKAIIAERDSGGRNGGVIAVDWNAAAENEAGITSYKNLLLNTPSKVPGAPDLVYKKTRQRVRRTCHECKTQFRPGVKICGGCQHVRCTDCPRDPAKKDKYPFGYPGDVFGPSAIPVHGCHMCKAMFPAGAADGVECARCQHKKCTDCRRLRPCKVEPELDPALVRSVEEKLKALNVSDNKSRGAEDRSAAAAAAAAAPSTYSVGGKRPVSASGSELERYN